MIFEIIIFFILRDNNHIDNKQRKKGRVFKNNIYIINKFYCASVEEILTWVNRDMKKLCDIRDVRD